MNVIIDTPADFLPYLLIVAIVTTFLFGYVKAIPAYNDKNKELLRAGTIVERFKYGMDYLISDAVGFAIVIAMAIVIPGIVYVSFFGSEPALAGCLVIAFLVSAIGGYGGVAVLHSVIDTFRDRDKIAKLEKKERANHRNHRRGDLPPSTLYSSRIMNIRSPSLRSSVPYSRGSNPYFSSILFNFV